MTVDLLAGQYDIEKIVTHELTHQWCVSTVYVRSNFYKITLTYINSLTMNVTELFL